MLAGLATAPLAVLNPPFGLGMGLGAAGASSPPTATANMRAVSYLDYGPGWDFATYFGQNGLTQGYQGAGVLNGRGGIADRIRAKFTILAGGGSVQVFGLSGTYQYSTDLGATWSAPVVCNTPGFNAVTYLPLCSLAPGTYELHVINDTTHGESSVEGNNDPVGLRLVNGSFNTSPAFTAYAEIWGVLSDSLWIGWLVPSHASDSPAVKIVQDLLGTVQVGLFVRGIGGSTVVAAGQFDTANITNNRVAPNVILLADGGNDDVSTGGAQATFQTAVGVEFAAACDNAPQARVYRLTMVPSGSQDLATRTTKTGLITAGCGGSNARPNGVVASMEGTGITDPPSAADEPDGTHWSGAAGQKVATLVESLTWTPRRLGLLQLWLEARYGCVYKTDLTTRCANLDAIGKFLDYRDQLNPSSPTRTYATFSGAGPVYHQSNASLAWTGGAQLVLSSPLTFNGKFTVYAVGFYAAVSNYTTLAGSVGNQALALFNTTQVYWPGAAGSPLGYTGTTGQVIVQRWRRDVSNQCYCRTTGMAEVFLGADATTKTFDTLGYWPAAAQFDPSSTTNLCLIAVSNDLGDGGPNDLLVRSYIQQWYGVTM